MHKKLGYFYLAVSALLFAFFISMAFFSTGPLEAIFSVLQNMWGAQYIAPVVNYLLMYLVTAVQTGMLTPFILIFGIRAWQLLRHTQAAAASDFKRGTLFGLALFSTLPVVVIFLTVLSAIPGADGFLWTKIFVGGGTSLVSAAFLFPLLKNLYKHLKPAHHHHVAVSEEK